LDIGIDREKNLWRTLSQADPTFITGITIVPVRLRCAEGKPTISTRKAEGGSKRPPAFVFSETAAGPNDPRPFLL
jgi:hypothetical protein